MKSQPIDTHPTMLFREDIEGLRGFAVLLVLFLHFKAPFITGGFIGVDIFFVLSGFLITGIIYQGISKNKFSFVDFYNRRIKRLSPALILVVFSTIIYFTFVLQPENYISFMRTARDVFLFQSNNRFEKDLSDYFSVAAGAMPLLHTWSLSVEWQFYFIFPFILFAIIKLTKKPLLIIIILTVISFSYSVSIVNSGVPSYFSTTARFFEFLIGSSAFFITLKRSFPNYSILSYLALFSLLIMSFFYTGEMPYPSWNALAVALACFIILLFGHKNNFLRSHLMRYLGKLSYSAYLWHWPIAVACYYLEFETGGIWLLPLILGTFAISSLSYRFVETPARQSKISFKTSLFLGVVLPVLIIVTSFYYVRKYEGFPPRLGKDHALAYYTIKANHDPMRDKCNNFTGDIEECAFGYLSEKAPRLLLIGDSHAGHMKGFIDVISQDAKFKAYIQTGSECLMLPGSYNPIRNQREGACPKKRVELYKLINKSTFDYVVLSQRWLGYSSDTEALTKTLKDAIKQIIQSGARPALIYPVAEVGNSKKDLYLCFLNNIKDPSACDIKQKDSNHRLRIIYGMFDEIIKTYPELIIIDPQSVQCVDGICLTHDKGIPFYTDSHHINNYTSKMFAKMYLDDFGNPFNGAK